MSDCKLKVVNLSKAYGKGAHKTQALTAVDFELGAGFYALLGSNGAGKTTLFQLLTGLFVPDQGELYIQGLNIRQQLVAALAHLGVVFQQPSLDLDLTVQANLDFYGRLHGLAKADIRKRSTDSLAQLGLETVANQVCRTLSGGNRRKVELARALLTQPAVLLMDEATVGLDPNARASLLNYVSELSQTQNTCVLWATHLIDEAERANEILILHQGVLLNKSTPASLMASTTTNTVLEAFFKVSGQTPITKPSPLAI